MTERLAVSLRCAVEQKGTVRLALRGPPDDAGCYPITTEIIGSIGGPTVHEHDAVELEFRTVWDEDEPTTGVSAEMTAHHVDGVDGQAYHLGLGIWMSWRDVEAVHAALGAMIAGRKGKAFV